MAWHQINHTLFKDLSKLSLGPRVVVLCSGGLDSMVLTHALSEVRKPLKLDLKVLHFHHGSHRLPKPSSVKQAAYRDQAQAKVASFCLQLGIELEVVQAERALQTEAEMREFRIQERKRRLESVDAFALAHHADDLLETRVFRILRGTGIAGLKAMNIWNPSTKALRPFLNFHREEILDYANWHGLSWLEDPSNQDIRYARNWIRQRLFPVLEKRFPRSKTHLSEFLNEILASRSAKDFREQDSAWTSSDLNQGPEDLKVLSVGSRFNRQFNRQWFRQLQDREQRQWLAEIFQEQPNLPFSRSQLVEVQKRLLLPKKQQKFAVAGRVWQTDRLSFWCQAESSTKG